MRRAIAAGFQGSGVETRPDDEGEQHAAQNPAGRTSLVSRAARAIEFGGLDSVSIVERDVPEPGEDEVLVRVTHAGVHPLEALIAAGGIPFARAPLVLGAVGAGEVESDGQSFRRGDRVAILGNELGMVRDGVWADHAAIPERLLAKIPEGLDPAAAAAMGIAFPTAVLAVEQAGVQQGGTLLVIGASGAVGTAALQIAAARGQTVVGTSRTPEGAAFAAEHGAHHTIDLSERTIAEAAAEITADGFFDGIVDPVGGQVTAEAIKTLRPGGVHAVLGYSAGFESNVFLPDIVNYGRKLEGCNMNARGLDGLRAAEDHSLEGLASGTYRVVVAQTFPLEAFAEASAAGKAPEVQGRVLLEL
jgi:NADPH:quinone reductase-like Zn-dependent oxidoreductase